MNKILPIFLMCFTALGADMKYSQYPNTNALNGAELFLFALPGYNATISASNLPAALGLQSPTNGITAQTATNIAAYQAQIATNAANLAIILSLTSYDTVQKRIDATNDLNTVLRSVLASLTQLQASTNAATLPSSQNATNATALSTVLGLSSYDTVTARQAATNVANLSSIGMAKLTDVNAATNGLTTGGQTNDAIVIAGSGVTVTTNGPTGGKTSYSIAATGSSGTAFVTQQPLTNNVTATNVTVLGTFTAANVPTTAQLQASTNAATITSSQNATNAVNLAAMGFTTNAYVQASTNLSNLGTIGVALKGSANFFTASNSMTDLGVSGTLNVTGTLNVSSGGTSNYVGGSLFTDTNIVSKYGALFGNGYGLTNIPLAAITNTGTAAPATVAQLNGATNVASLPSSVNATNATALATVLALSTTYSTIQQRQDATNSSSLPSSVNATNGSGAIKANLFLPTQVAYTTNQAIMSPDFALGYQYIATNASFAFLLPVNVDSTKTLAQTCVVLVTNSGASTITVTVPTGIGATNGTWNVTNAGLSAFTFFCYPKVITNAVGLAIK